MLALKASAAPLVEPMAKTLVALLDATSHAPCLAALGTCAEVFGAVPDAEKLLSSALDAVLERALLRLQVCGCAACAILCFHTFSCLPLILLSFAHSSFLCRAFHPLPASVVSFVTVPAQA